MIFMKDKVLLSKLKFVEEIIKRQQPSPPTILNKAKRIFSYGPPYWKHLLIRAKFLPNKDLKARLFWGEDIHLPLFDSEAFYLAYFGTLWRNQELRLTKFLIKNLQPNDVFYDVGASYGFYTRLAYQIVASEGEVHAFEPHPKVFPYFQKFGEKKVNVFLNNIALSDKNGESLFIDSLMSGGSSGGSRLSDDLKKARSGAIVTTSTLDSYVNKHKAPTFIKIDVEGAESLVIEGGKEFFKNNSPVIVMEVWGKEQKIIHSHAVNRLCNMNYKIYKLDENGNISYESEINFDKLKGYENFIFKK